jgi:putative transposase
MYLYAGQTYHIYNRGNNKQTVFFKPENYIFLLNKVKKEWLHIADILCWCLMPNHFHFMIHANENTCLERKSFGGKPMQEFPHRIGKLLSSYTQAINNQNNTTGSLFQQKTKAKNVSSYGQDASSNSTAPERSYVINCMHYIHQNPWKAGLVNSLEDWPYSSFADIAGLREDDLCNKQLLIQLTGYDMSTFFKDSYGVIEEDILKSIL